MCKKQILHIAIRVFGSQIIKRCKIEEKEVCDKLFNNCRTPANWVRKRIISEKDNKQYLDVNGRKCAEQEKFAEKSEIVKMANNQNKLYKMRIKKHSLCKMESYEKILTTKSKNKLFA